MEEKFKLDDTRSWKPQKLQQFASRTERKSNKNKRKETKEEEIVPMKKIVEEDEGFRTWEQLGERMLLREGKMGKRSGQFFKNPDLTSHKLESRARIASHQRSRSTDGFSSFQLLESVLRKSHRLQHVFSATCNRHSTQKTTHVRKRVEPS